MNISITGATGANQERNLYSMGNQRAMLMCLGIPMQIMAIDGLTAHCAAKGVEREVNLFLLQDASIGTGDFVLVHVGYAIQKIAADHARSAWELYDEMLASAEPPLHA